MLAAVEAGCEYVHVGLEWLKAMLDKIVNGEDGVGLLRASMVGRVVLDGPAVFYNRNMKSQINSVVGHSQLPDFVNPQTD